jgi:hypothetical protein
MRFAPPPHVLALAGAAVAVHVARKVLKGSNGESRTRSRPRPASTPKATAVVHAFHSSSLSPSLSEAGSPPGGTSSRAVLNSGLVVLAATLLIIAAAGVAALRQQWDLAGAVAVAWLLVLLSQVGSSSRVELV